jgi:hypothetical protein
MPFAISKNWGSRPGHAKSYGSVFYAILLSGLEAINPKVS